MRIDLLLVKTLGMDHVLETFFRGVVIMKKTTFIVIALLVAMLAFVSCQSDPVTGVSLDKTEIKILKGETEKLIATVSPGDATNKKVTWSSSNPAVATVSEDGTVTAVTKGEATITVKTKNGGKTASCDVTVVEINGVPLTLEFPAAGKVTITKMGDPGTVKYSVNGGEKKTVVYDSPIDVPADGKISFYRTLETDLTYENFIRIKCTKECYVYGNVMSLIKEADFEDLTTIGYAYAFSSLFMSNKEIMNHPEKELLLPAEVLSEGCYNLMFASCSLTNAPAIPAKELAPSCYDSMFMNCTSLIAAPELPAKTLVDFCYHQMFQDCTSLNSITCLATDISAYNCTALWVSGVDKAGTFYCPVSMQEAWNAKGAGNGKPASFVYGEIK